MKKKQKSKNSSSTSVPLFSFTTSTSAPAFDDHVGFSEEECKAVLRFFNLPYEDYFEWMGGQTCPMLTNGNIGYYWYDLHRYINWKVRGVRPIFD